MAGPYVSAGQAIRAGINVALDELHTAMPAKVTAYDPITHTVVVQPALKQSIVVGSSKRTFVALPEIPFVPVVFPRSGGMVMRFPIEPGDWVWLMFSEGSMAEWKRRGSVSEPQDARRHSIGWPVAIPGAYPNVEPLSPLDAAAVTNGQAVFGQDGGKQMRVGPTGIELAPAGVTPVSPVALSDPTDDALETLTDALNATIASLNALIGKYNAHTHAVSGAAASATLNTATSAEDGPAAPDTTASTIARAV
jgi:Phage protein Gp138 N-terminal domain